MNIRINAVYTLVSDESNIIIAKDTGKVDKNGNPVREFLKFYSNLEDALNGYARMQIMASEANTMAKLLEEVRSLKKFIHDLLVQETEPK